MNYFSICFLLFFTFCSVISTAMAVPRRLVASSKREVAFVCEDGKAYEWDFFIADFRELDTLSGRVLELDGNLENFIALTIDGEVFVWGANENGQLGQGTQSAVRNLTPMKVNFPKNDFIVSVRSYGAISAALARDGTLYFFGGSQQWKVPTEIQNLKFSRIFHSCLAAERSDGTYCFWLDNDNELEPCNIILEDNERIIAMEKKRMLTDKNLYIETPFVSTKILLETVKKKYGCNIINLCGLNAIFENGRVLKTSSDDGSLILDHSGQDHVLDVFVIDEHQAVVTKAGGIIISKEYGYKGKKEHIKLEKKTLPVFWSVENHRYCDASTKRKVMNFLFGIHVAHGKKPTKLPRFLRFKICDLAMNQPYYENLLQSIDGQDWGTCNKRSTVKFEKKRKINIEPKDKNSKQKTQIDLLRPIQLVENIEDLPPQNDNVQIHFVGEGINNNRMDLNEDDNDHGWDWILKEIERYEPSLSLDPHHVNDVNHQDVGQQYQPMILNGNTYHTFTEPDVTLNTIGENQPSRYIPEGITTIFALFSHVLHVARNHVSN